MLSHDEKHVLLTFLGYGLERLRGEHFATVVKCSITHNHYLLDPDPLLYPALPLLPQLIPQHFATSNPTTNPHRLSRKLAAAQNKCTYAHSWRAQSDPTLNPRE